MEPKLNLEELLHMLKSKQYVVSSLSGNKIKIFTTDQNGVLLQNDFIKICRVTRVKIKPLDITPPEVDHPVAKLLIEKVGKTPSKKLFQYQFTPVGTRLIQRIDTGTEFYEIVDEPAAEPIIVHVAHLYYVAYISRSAKIYDETPGGARAYVLHKKGVLTWPHYVFRRDAHRVELGVRIPLDEEQISRLVSYLYSC